MCGGPGSGNGPDDGGLFENRLNLEIKVRLQGIIHYLKNYI
jgi:hypothetical protein